MRNPFVISLLSTALFLSGCAGSKTIELGTVESQSIYDDRLLDSLGSQRYTEQQMLYVRKVETLENQLEELEEKRRALESSIGLGQLEAGAGAIMHSDDEAARMSEFASATHATQARIAEEHASRAMQQALIENERDRRLMQAEIEANRKLADLDEDQRAADQRAQEARDKASSEHAQLLEKQRMAVVLANADAERRVQKEIEALEKLLAELRGDKSQAVSGFKAEIAQYNERIKLLEGHVASTEAEFDAKMEYELGRLYKLRAEAQKLAELGESLMETQLSVSTRPGQASVIKQPGNLTPQPAISEDLSRDLNGREERLIRAELAATKTEITNTARTEMASLEVKTELAKADIVAPVVTTRAVYSGSYGDEPKAFAARAKAPSNRAVAASTEVKPKKPIATQVAAVTPRVQPKASDAVKVTPVPDIAVAPIRVVSTFEPRHDKPVRHEVQESVVTAGTMSGGQVQALVIGPRATTYNVVYRYAEKGSAEKFMAFLRAYGIDDFTYRHSEELNEHVLFMGKFTDKDRALARVAFLNRTTNTANAKIVENDL